MVPEFTGIPRDSEIMCESFEFSICILIRREHIEIMKIMEESVWIFLSGHGNRWNVGKYKNYWTHTHQLLDT